MQMSKKKSTLRNVSRVERLQWFSKRSFLPIKLAAVAVRESKHIRRNDASQYNTSKKVS